MSLLLPFSPIAVSQATQAGLNKVVDGTYLLRGGYRVYSAIPPEKQPSYTFRDFYLTAANPLFFEFGRRLLNNYFVAPKMTEILELNKLKLLYNGQFSKINNYKSLFELPNLQPMLLGNVVRTQSLYTIPDLYAKTPGFDPVLAHHLQRRLGFAEHLDAMVAKGTVKQNIADAVREGVNFLRGSHLNIEKHFEKPLEKTLYKLQYKDALSPNQISQVEKHIDAFFQGQAPEKRSMTQVACDGIDSGWHFFKKLVFLEKWKTEPPQKLSGLYSVKGIDATVKAKLEAAHAEMKALAHSPSDVLKRFSTLQNELAEHKALGWIQAQGKSFSQAEHKQLKHLLGEAMQARFVRRKLELVKNAFLLPDAIATSAAVFLLMGVAGTWVDNKLIIPWQRDYIKKGGNPSIVRLPSIVSLIPAVGLFAALLQPKSPVNKLGYVGKLAFAAPVAFAAYTAMAAGWIKHRLKKAEPNLKPLATPVNAQPTPKASSLPTGTVRFAQGMPLPQFNLQGPAGAFAGAANPFAAQQPLQGAFAMPAAMPFATAGQPQ
ncbi:MAG: hypothetical protein VKJ06_08490 [Vampirovibrionales bacterium]|nr:hypothetical protein [Vampirovibrionales bacterium]